MRRKHIIGLVGAVALTLPGFAVEAPLASAAIGQPLGVTQYCSMIASATTEGATAAPPLVGQGCFRTLALSQAYAAQVTLAYRAAHPTVAGDAPVSRAASLHLGVSYSGGNYSGQRIDWYGSGSPCAGTLVYEFQNFSGWVNNGLASDAQDVASGAHCGKAHFFDNGNLSGTNWYCLGYFIGQAYQTCEPSMPTGDLYSASSVRMGYEPNS